MLCPSSAGRRADTGPALPPLPDVVDLRPPNSQPACQVTPDAGWEFGVSRRPGVEGASRQDDPFHILERQNAETDGVVVARQPVAALPAGAASVCMSRKLDEYLRRQRLGSFDDREGRGEGALAQTKQHL